MEMLGDLLEVTQLVIVVSPRQYGSGAHALMVT